MGWALRWKPVFLLARRSSDDREQPIPAHGPRPAPYHPGVLALPEGKEDDLRAPGDVLERHIADLAEHAAVGGIVAIVAHQGRVAGRPRIDRRSVVRAAGDKAR